MKAVNFILVTDSLAKSANRESLVGHLASLRKRYPDAQIMGISELDGDNIKVSDDMNKLRRALSDKP